MAPTSSSPRALCRALHQGCRRKCWRSSGHGHLRRGGVARSERRALLVELEHVALHDLGVRVGSGTVGGVEGGARGAGLCMRELGGRAASDLLVGRPQELVLVVVVALDNTLERGPADALRLLGELACDMNTRGRCVWVYTWALACVGSTRGLWRAIRASLW